MKTDEEYSEDAEEWFNNWMDESYRDVDGIVYELKNQRVAYLKERDLRLELEEDQKAMVEAMDNLMDENTRLRRTFPR